MAKSDLIPERLSPLTHRSAVTGDGDLVMKEAPLLGKLILRIDAEAGSKAVDAATKGAALPTTPCSVSHSDDGAIAILWLGPDEWMLMTARDSEKDLTYGLSMGLSGTHHQLSDVTDYYTAIDISGATARELLMNLTTLDLHPRGFSQGQVKGSMFGHAQAYLWQLSTEPGQAESFRLIVRASMADYLWCLLTRSGRTLGLREELPIEGEQLTL